MRRFYMLAAGTGALAILLLAVLLGSGLAAAFPQLIAQAEPLSIARTLAEPALHSLLAGLVLLGSFLLGLLNALYLFEYASQKIRDFACPLLHLLSHLPLILSATLLLPFPALRSLGGLAALPLCIWWCCRILASFPSNINMAGRVLGIHRNQIINTLLLPAAKPALVSVFGLLVFRAVLEALLAAALVSASPDNLSKPLLALIILGAAITSIGSNSAISLIVRRSRHAAS